MPKDNPKDNTLIGHIDQQVNGDLEKVEFILKSKSRLEMVGLPGFEPESIEPKSTSLDQASRQPQVLQRKIISNES